MRVAPFVPFGIDRLSMMAGLGLRLTLAGCLEKPSRPASEGPPQAGVITLQPTPRHIRYLVAWPHERHRDLQGAASGHQPDPVGGRRA
jgi:hypothetical protein